MMITFKRINLICFFCSCFVFILMCLLLFLGKRYNVWEHFASSAVKQSSKMSPYKIVNTLSGPIRGKVLNTIIEHKPYYSFRGIPYAEPPLQNLRFLPPRPITPWTTVLDCIEFQSMCLQQSMFTLKEIGDENCLYLNVYTPDTEPTELLAVMFYVHGGAWYVGSGAVIGPDFLIEQNVVVVTINYRLNVMGFMSLGTPEYSGNQGLKDQQLALKWINANIERFGGNKNRVTLFGDSAGSVSCQFHMLAPGSKGLFQRAIEMSFTFNVFAILDKSNHTEDMFRFARKQNDSIETHDELIQFLRAADQHTFLASFPLEIDNRIVNPIFEKSNALQPFAVISPSEFIHETGNYTGNVDVMTGFTTGETLFFGKTEENAKEFLENFRIPIPNIHFNMAYNSSDYQAAAEKIRKHYFAGSRRDVLQNFVKLESDVSQRYFIDQRIKRLAEESTGRTYYYRFGLETSLNFFKFRYGTQRQPGAAHADDLCYVAVCNFSNDALRMYGNVTVHSLEHNLIKTMSGLYANFAKYGNPLPDGQPDFQPVRPGKYTFLDITNDGLFVDEDPFKEDAQFWDDLMEEYPDLLTLWQL